jgi:HEAT repeat protein
LLELLKSDSPLKRAAAALSLPWYADEAALGPLEGAMKDPDESVRRAAAWAHAALKRLISNQG